MTEQRKSRLARILLVRHGATASNKVRYVGWEDEPLDDNGSVQALALSERLEQEHVDIIYSSSLSRARGTIAPLARVKSLPIVERDELKEINFGDFQGLTKEGHTLNLRSAHISDPMPNGECLEDVMLRIGLFRQDLDPILEAGASVVIVGHFWSNRVLLGSLLGLQVTGMMSRINYKPKNGSVLDVTCTANTGTVQVLSTRMLHDGGEP